MYQPLKEVRSEIDQDEELFDERLFVSRVWLVGLYVSVDVCKMCVYVCMCVSICMFMYVKCVYIYMNVGSWKL